MKDNFSITGLIYEISFDNGRYKYVGSTKKSIEERIYQHVGELNRNQHINQIMQNVYNKYKDSMQYNILEDKILLNNLIEREQFYIDNPKYNLNICKKADIPPTHYKKLSLYDLYGNLVKICNTREEVADIIGVCKEMVGKYKNIVCLKNYYVCDSELLNEKEIIIPVRRVGKYDLDGNLINIYNNPTDIAKEINKANSYIFNVLKGKRKTAFGFTYRYINDKIINKIEI